MDCSKHDLVTFGCSFTYGHGLKDCLAEDGIGNGPKPSVLAWPNHLKSMCNFRTVDNQAEPGASNKIITKLIMDYKKFSRKSFVVIFWTNFDRQTVFYSKDYGDYLHMMPGILQDRMPKKFFEYHGGGIKENRPSPMKMREMVETYYMDYHSDFDVYFDNIIRINYVNSWLKEKGIESRHVFMEHEWNRPAVFENKRYFNRFTICSRTDIRVLS